MEDEGQDNCYGAGSIAGAVIGTFLTTILLLTVAALLYRQWRRHKGKHLVLVTDPEIVEDAYAFDNPCFKDATPAAGRSLERPVSMSPLDIPVKDSARWSTPWSSLGLGSTNRNDKRRTLDDSCLGPKATRVSVVSLRSRDFTGLGFNVCGNMREGIFVKDLLHRGPASESGRIHPGDRIASVKISFRSMVYEDALTILSYASPYDVELEVESGGPGSKPATLLKKSVGPSPTRICHPLYRSQSIPELSQTHKNSAKRLFIADPNESLGSNYSTMNSTLKSSKSTPGNQTLERRHEETKNNHHKFGIKVLPALDGTVHRIENQNEHNTNLERRNSKKVDAEKHLTSTWNSLVAKEISPMDDKKKTAENLQQQENTYYCPKPKKLIRVDGTELNGIDVPDNGEENNIPSEVPEEVHNAAVAARRNRKNSAELLSAQKVVVESNNDTEDAKSPQKNKRKAPAPPKTNTPIENSAKKDVVSSQYESDDKFDSITDYAESLNDYVNKIRETTDGAEARRQRMENQAAICRRNSESDTDSEVQNSFTTIELNPADITIHHTPVPEVDDDIYRKAASLGDLSKYESKASTTLERAQSLDMTDTGSKRKAPLPPEDINESTEDLTKLDQMDTFERRKLKKSNKWGTLEDAIWSKGESEEKKSRMRKKSNGTLERSKSAVEIKLKEDVASSVSERLNVFNDAAETSIELYNLPLSKQLTRDFIHTERMFNPDEDNSLARIVNNGTVVKSPTIEDMELDFRQAKPLPDDDEDSISETPVNEKLGKALRQFDLHASRTPMSSERKVNLVHADITDGKKPLLSNDASMYEGRKEVIEEPITKITLDTSCPGCDHRFDQHDKNCTRKVELNMKNTNDVETVQFVKQNASDNKSRESSNANQNKREDIGTLSSGHQIQSIKLESLPAYRIRDMKFDVSDIEVKKDSISAFQAHRTKFEPALEVQNKIGLSNQSKANADSTFETQLAKRIVNVSDDKEDNYDSGSSVTVNNKNVSVPIDDQHNVSNVSVSSDQKNEDSDVVRATHDLNRQDSEARPPLPNTPMPLPISPHKMTYITEIKVSTSMEDIHVPDSENEEVVAIVEGTVEDKQHEITVTSNGKPTSGKKPPIPPRRSDMSKVVKDDLDKQVVYVSEYKSSVPSRDSQTTEVNASEGKPSGAMSKKFEQWVFLGENKENPWENGSSQPQSITNIVLSPTDEKIIHQ